jgi:hypothetical protein
MDNPMVQRICSVDRNSCVVITMVNGNLHTHTWKEPLIVIEVEGPIAEFRQEGNTLIVTGCQGDLALWIPTITDSGITTDISVTHLSGDVTIEAAKQVKLSNIGGNVTLRDIAGDVKLEIIRGVTRLTNIRGDVQATSIPTLLVDRGIVGDASLSDIMQIEIDSVGGNAMLDRVRAAEIIAVSGDLEAAAIEITIRCTTVGGDCWVRNSPRAEIGISNVAENLYMEGIVHGRMSNIGGDLDLRATFPAGSTTRFHVDSNATVTLPNDASLVVHAMVGGEVSGEALGSHGGGGFLNLVYGDGAATLNLNIGGDLKLLGTFTPRRMPYF